MKDSIVLDLVEHMLRYHAGRYATLPVVEALKRDLTALAPFGAVAFNVNVGREMTCMFFSRNSLHGLIATRRYPALDHEEKNDAFPALVESWIKNVVLTLKTTPNAFTVKSYHYPFDRKWRMVDHDELGVAIVRGLTLRNMTMAISNTEFSVFGAPPNSSGWRFKPPVYYDNLLTLPQQT